MQTILVERYSMRIDIIVFITQQWLLLRLLLNFGSLERSFMILIFIKYFRNIKITLQQYAS